MINVTDSAIQLAEQLIKTNGPGPGFGIRLAVLPETEMDPQYDIRFDLQAENDVVFGHEGAEIFITHQSLAILEGAKLDVKETEEGMSFRILTKKMDHPSCSSASSCSSCSSSSC